LSEEFADDLIGVGFGAEEVELSHDFQERLLDVMYGPFGVVLPLLLQALLALEKFFAVEIGHGVENRFAMGTRIGQEAGQAVPGHGHIPDLLQSSYRTEPLSTQPCTVFLGSFF
jgi:hypothetical protein